MHIRTSIFLNSRWCQYWMTTVGRSWNICSSWATLPNKQLECCSLMFQSNNLSLIKPAEVKPIEKEVDWTSLQNVSINGICRNFLNHPNTIGRGETLFFCCWISSPEKSWRSGGSRPFQIRRVFIFPVCGGLAIQVWKSGKICQLTTPFTSRSTHGVSSYS